VPDEHRVRRWAREARVDAVTLAILAGFVAVRLVVTLGQPIAAFPDSPSYFEFRLWGGVRFPVVTAVYALLGDHRAVVTVQALSAAFAWSVAAVVAGSVVAHRVVRESFRVALLALGLTLPVTRFDHALLSESFAISLTVVLVATIVRFVCRPTRASAVAVGALGVVWGFARQNHALLLAITAVLLLGFGAGRVDRRRVWPVAALFALAAVVGIALATSTSQIQEYNTATIMVRRVLPDDARERWFRDRGMPGNGDAVVAGPYPPGIGDAAVALERDRRYGRWIREDAPSTYLRYLLTHPGFVVTTPFSDDGALRAFAVGATGYGASDRALPDPVESLVWPTTSGDQTFIAVVAVGILAAGVGTATRSRAHRRALAAAGGVLLVAAANVVIVTHTAGWEYERLLVPTAVAARIALLWLLATVIGGVSVAPTTDGPDPAHRRRGGARSRPADVPAPHSDPDPDGEGSRVGSATGPGSGRPGTP
jgi:hypothetical protein